MTSASRQYRSILPCLLFAISLAVPAAVSAATSTAEKTTVPFQQELYDLGYTVFLANSNPEDAWRVALMALKNRPHDREWLKRAAQTAEWSGHPEMAMGHWSELAEVGDTGAVKRALELARQLNDLGLQKKLVARQLAQGDQKLLKEYIGLAEATGEPEEALQALKQPDQKWDPAFVRAEQFRLYDLTGHPQKALTALETLLAVRPLTAAEALRGATIWYGIGQPDKSWQLLQQASEAMPPSETTFWETISDLGWALDHRQQAVRASEILLKDGKVRSADYQRMVDYYRKLNNQRAFDAAQAGWLQFHEPLFLYGLLETGQALERWPQLRHQLDELTPQELKQVQESSYFWGLAAQVYRQTGAPEKSLQASWQAVRKDPANGNVVAAHLWLLIEQGKSSEALPIAEAWSVRVWRDSSLLDAIGAVYAAIGDSRRALTYYRLSYSQHRNDPAWLASYADLLEQAGKPEAGYLARFMAVKALRTHHYREMTPATWKELRNLTGQLRLQASKGDQLDALFRQIANGPQDDVSRDMVTAWLLATEKHDQGRLWFMKAYLENSRKPAWAALNLALQQNDLPAIEALLAHSLSRLPYRDAVEASRRAGQVPLAETIAFERFQLNDRDYLLDKQLRDLYQLHPASLRYNLGVSDRSGVGLLEQQLLLSTPLDKRTFLKVELVNTDFRHLKTGVLGQYVSSKQKALLGFGYQYNGGTASASAGMHDGLYLYPTGLLQADWRFASWLTADLSIGIGAEANESVPLLIGGMKDEAALGATWRLTGRDSLRLRAATFSFMDQMRRYLGAGNSLDLELGHRVNVAWPDFTLRFFGSYHQHHANGTPVDKTLMLIPRDAEKNASYYIPVSFGQVGGGIAIGQTWKETYTRNWKLFGAVDTSWNSVSGMGFSYELGATGPLLGLDTLLFSLSQESGAFGNSDLSTRIGLKYRYLFN
ncbi:MAG: tetratricopeptide repeat protein [Geobacter sp.]|nr:tetratricopeptide repeat protein [Geobacter sp.]